LIIGLISNTGKSKERLLDMLTNEGVDIRLISPPYEGDEIKECDIIHFFPGYHLLKESFSNRLRGKKMVNHWIGTDVASAVRFHKRRFSAVFTNKLFDIQLAVSSHLVKELKSIGVTARVMPNVPDISSDTPVEFPRSKKGVMVYLPENRVVFHRWRMIAQIAEEFPSVTFHIVAHSGNGLEKSKNIDFHGWLSDGEMEKVWSRVNALLRIPKHDGLPLMLLEGLARGKYVMWSYPFPNCYHVTTMKNLKNSLKEVLEKDEPNYSGREYVLRKYDPQIIAREYKKMYRSLLKNR
jgi:glycosyltransferase involved in cell wall biosynthesis